MTLWAWRIFHALEFHDDGFPPSVRADVWLVIEWEPGEPAPTKFYVASMPAKMTHKQLVRIIKLRWRTERMYEDMKGELGLDHFEGRSYRGWSHHVSAVMCCYAFVCAEQARAFSPSAPEHTEARTQHSATGAPLPQFVHHCPYCDSPHHRALAPAMPSLPSVGKG